MLYRNLLPSTHTHPFNPRVKEVAIGANYLVADLVRTEVEVTANDDEVASLACVSDELTHFKALCHSMCLVHVWLLILGMQLKTAMNITDNWLLLLEFTAVN